MKDTQERLLRKETFIPKSFQNLNFSFLCLEKNVVQIVNIMYTLLETLLEVKLVVVMVVVLNAAVKKKQHDKFKIFEDHKFENFYIKRSA